MSMASTRRGFIAGALAGAAVPAVAGAQTAPAVGPLQAKQRIVRRGRAIAVGPKGSPLVVAHDRRRSIAIITRGRERLVDVGGQPLEIAVSPDGRVAAITTASWDEPGLVIVDLKSATVRKRVDVGPAPFAVAFTHAGKRLVVSGGEQEGTVHVLDTKDFRVLVKAAIGAVPRGIAVLRSDREAWIALNGDARLARVDLRNGRVKRLLRTPRQPDRIALSPNGRRLLVSHGGRDAGRVSEIVTATGRVRHHRVGPLPSAVAWTARGDRLVALGGGAAVVKLGGRRAQRRVGAAPRGLAVAGGRAWTVSALTGAVSRVKT